MSIEMKKEEIAYHLRGRWGAVREIEIEELRKTSLEDRFIQTLSIFDLGKSLNLRVRRMDAEIHAIIARWRQLKGYYGESK